jgi:hypothetical protein
MYVAEWYNNDMDYLVLVTKYSPTSNVGRKRKDVSSRICCHVTVGNYTVLFTIKYIAS